MSWAPVCGKLPPMIRLFGSVTSPYARRVRILLEALGLPFDWVDTMTEEGQRLLRERSPVFKVPILEFEGQLLFDSHAICAFLSHRYPDSGVATPLITDLESQNFLSVVDTALDSLIQRFYLLRDGSSPDLLYAQRQTERAGSAFVYLEARLPILGSGLDALSLALGTALDWIRLRDAYDLSRHPELLEWLSLWS
ncbi:MAG: hypothetical protein RJA70_4570, partial [Pseudomonadota bacterium]